jgi:uncharacterized protein YdaU (DUF1376 family)
MARLPWFPFYTLDFIGDYRVSLMTFEERGAYITLLCHAWRDDPQGSLSSQAIATLLAPLSEASRDVVLACFELRGERYFQKRMVEEAAKITARSDALRAAGSRGGLQKALNASSQAIATLKPGSSHPLANNNQINNHKEEQIPVHAHTRAREKKPTRRLAADVDSLILPLFLDAKEFRAALQHWIDHRKLKRDPLTQHALELVVKKCEVWGPDKSVQYINTAISKAWTDVYEPSENFKPKPKSNSVL